MVMQVGAAVAPPSSSLFFQPRGCCQPAQRSLNIVSQPAAQGRGAKGKAWAVSTQRPHPSPRSLVPYSTIKARVSCRPLCGCRCCLAFPLSVPSLVAPLPHPPHRPSYRAVFSVPCDTSDAVVRQTSSSTRAPTPSPPTDRPSVPPRAVCKLGTRLAPSSPRLVAPPLPPMRRAIALPLVYPEWPLPPSSPPTIH